MEYTYFHFQRFYVNFKFILLILVLDRNRKLHGKILSLLNSQLKLRFSQGKSCPPLKSEYFSKSFNKSEMLSKHGISFLKHIFNGFQNLVSRFGQ